MNCHALTEFARQATEAEFLRVMDCGSLVGSAIRNGEVTSATSKRGELGSSKTLTFKPSEVSTILSETLLTEAIFALRKGHDGDRSSQFCQVNIGRAVENDIRVVDFAVSRFHARISASKGRYAIADLKSRNGTRVNGESITALPRELKDGDLVSFGRYEFTFMYPESLYRRLQVLKFRE